MRNKVLFCSLIAGLSGTILIFILLYLDLNLGFLTGYLFIIIAITSILLGHRLYKKSSLLPTSYWKRVLIGVVTYIVITLLYTLRQILRNQYKTYEGFSDYFPVILFHISFAAILSLIFSIRISSFIPRVP